MNAKELLQQNQRLQALLAQAEQALAQSQRDLAVSRQALVESQTQQAAVTEQFTATLASKDRQVAQLEHQIKLLLQRVRGSRQERIDPDQLLLFSLEELQEIARQLEQAGPAESDFVEVTPARHRRRKTRGRVGPLPEHLEREIVRHELTTEQRCCPGCGELRHEISVEVSEQLELVPARLKVLQHQRVKYACRAVTVHENRGRRGG